MAKKISELPAAVAVADTDELELNQSGTSRKGTRAQIVAGLASAVHTHSIADVTDAGALASQDTVAEGDIASGAVTTTKLADQSVTSLKLAPGAVITDRIADSAVATAQIAPGAVTSAKIASGAVGSGQLGANAVTSAKIAGGAVTADKIASSAVGSIQLAASAVTSAKIATDAVGPDQLAATTVTAGSYVAANLTVDAQGRITAASDGTAGEANGGTNVGTDGVGVFAGKVGVDLQFRHIAPASTKVTVVQNGQDIDIDVVDSNLQVQAGNVIGLAAVATSGTLASLVSLDADGGTLTNYLIAQDTVTGSFTFAQTDSGREKIFTGSGAATWTVPALAAGSHAVVHNLGGGTITFVASGVTLKGSTTLGIDGTAALSWLPGNVVKLIGELS